MRWQMASKAADESELYERIPASLRHKMMAFQREGVRFALAHGGRVLIGDEMGAGTAAQQHRGWGGAVLQVLGLAPEQWPGTRNRKRCFPAVDTRTWNVACGPSI